MSRRPELVTPQRKPHLPTLALTLDEAAQALGVSRGHLENQIRAGVPIPHMKLGARVLFPVAAVARWLDAQANASTTTDADTAGMEGGGA